MGRGESAAKPPRTQSTSGHSGPRADQPGPPVGHKNASATRLKLLRLRRGVTADGTPRPHVRRQPGPGRPATFGLIVIARLAR